MSIINLFFREINRFVFLAVLASAHLVTAQIQNDSLDDKRLSSIKAELEKLSKNGNPGLNETTLFSLVDAPIQELLRGIAQTHRLNISISPSIAIKVTNNFTNAVVKDLLYFLCKEYRLEIRFVNNIMSFHTFETPVKPEPKAIYQPKDLTISYDRLNNLLSLDLKNDSLTLFCKQVTKRTGKNVILAPEAEKSKISGYLQDVNFASALEKIAFSNNLLFEITEDSFYVFSPMPTSKGLGSKANTSVRAGGNSKNSKPIDKNLKIELIVNEQGDTLISINAFDVAIAQIISRASDILKKDYILFSEPPGNTTIIVEAITYDQLLRLLLQGTSHTFKNQEEVYLIGERNQEGLRSSQLVRLQFRTVEDIEKTIPEDMAAGVTIKSFPELNGLILSGGLPQITEIKDFLNAIDQPVPNILIEVMVVTLRKGYSLRTGISAFLSDSVPPTGGKIFPGMDVSINSSSINKVLDKLTNNGIINLGQVSPQFYIQMQALEDNNNININSTPKLATINGHEANLTIGQSEYYKEEVQNVTGGVNPIITNSPRFKSVEANLSLQIKPSVSADEHITLGLKAEFSSFVDPKIQGAPPGNDTRKFNSTIRVRNNEMVMMGGLENAEKSETSSGFPILSRIPVLKWLFSSRSETNRKEQIVVFIKPTVVY